MSKKEKLPPVPREKKRKPTPQADRDGAGFSAVPDAGPDLTHIIEPLRVLAVPVSELVFDPANARTHDEANLAAIRASLRVYGQRRPLVVNRRTGHVEAGNGTLQALLAENKTHAAVVYVDDDPATAKGYSIADNRTAELATWDEKALADLMEDLDTEDPGLQAMLDDLQKELPTPADPEPDSPAPDEPEPAPRLGVVIDCRDVEHQGAVLLQMQAAGEQARPLTFTEKVRLAMK